MIDKADLMTKAIQLRKELGEDSNSPVDIFSLALNIEGLTLVYYPMGDLSTATGIFYRQALRCHGLPFEVKVDEPNAVTYAAMEAAEKGEDMYGPFDSVADLMEALL